MKTIVKLFSNTIGEISRFLNNLYDINNNSENIEQYPISLLEWEKYYDNPIEMAEIIGIFIDNKDNYDINMWITLDKDILINITDHNVNEIIKYLYERFPY